MNCLFNTDLNTTINISYTTIILILMVHKITSWSTVSVDPKP